jgi:hypothetical protein
VSVRAGCGTPKKNVLAVSFLKCSSRSQAFFRFLFPQLSRRTLHSLLNTVQFRMGRNVHEFSIVNHNVQAMSDKFCVLFLMFDEMSIKKLSVLEDLRTLESMVGKAILHIMPWSP